MLWTILVLAAGTLLANFLMLTLQLFHMLSPLMVPVLFSIQHHLFPRTRLNGALLRITLFALLLPMVHPSGALIPTPTLWFKPVPLVRLISMLLSNTLATTPQVPLLPHLSVGLLPFRLATLTMLLPWNLSLTPSQTTRFCKPLLVPPMLFAAIPSSCTTTLRKRTQPGPILWLTSGLH